MLSRKTLMRRLVEGVLTAVILLQTSTVLLYAQSCPGENITCSRCGYWGCFSGGVLSYGTVTSVICFPSTNNCSGCVDEVGVDWTATCDGVTYSGGGTICCSVWS